MYDERLKIAYDKSDEVIKELDLDSDEIVATAEVIDYIKKHTNCKTIIVKSMSFKDLDAAKDCGAMMLVKVKESENVQAPLLEAFIILNSDHAYDFQRFSLLHELGHLMTLNTSEASMETVDENKYIVSTHIDYQITRIKEDEYKNDKYLLDEQIANIFALRVLMPTKQFYSVAKKYGEISKIAKFFGVTNDAVISRMMIGA